MGVYSQANTSEVLNNETFVECKYEPGIEAAYAIVAESEANYNAIMQAVGVAELAVFESTGEEMVYESGEVSGFFAKVKEFFLKIWEKIKGLFKKFFAMFDSFVKSDKEFVNKYKKHLLQVNTKDFEYKGFNFTELKFDIKAAGDRIANEITDEIGSVSVLKDKTAELDAALTKLEDKSELVEKLRGVALVSSGSTTYDASEFAKELFTKFRNGEDSKQVLDNINVVSQLQFIEENSGLKKEAEKAYKDFEKLIKDVIKEVDNEEKELLKAVTGRTAEEKKAAPVNAKLIKLASGLVALYKEQSSIIQLINGAKLTAIKDQNRQAKAICVSLMNYKPKNESYSFQDSFSESSFLGGVKLR